jgi:hypothetical protein
MTALAAAATCSLVDPGKRRDSSASSIWRSIMAISFRIPARARDFRNRGRLRHRSQSRCRSGWRRFQGPGAARHRNSGSAPILSIYSREAIVSTNAGSATALNRPPRAEASQHVDEVAGQPRGQ